MSYKEFYYKWEWNLPATPENLWPLVSDTNRFNQDTGLEALDFNEPSPTGMGRRLRFRRLGLVPVEWDESPFEWVYGRRFGVVRHYTQGPVAEMRVLTTLEPTGDGHTHLTYEVWARPKNLLGLLAIPVQIGILSARDFDRAFRLYGRLAQTHAPVAFVPAQVQLVPGGLGRVVTARANLLARDVDEDLLDKLIWLIQNGNELTVAHIRPYQLADLWGVPRRTVLELCLLATRAGLLDFQWELLCPMCRGAGENVHEHLEDVHSEVHCASCQIDFTANFERSVEITFQPAAAIRAVERLEFCVAGPQITPHIVAQQVLAPGEKRDISLGLQKGSYRLRLMGRGGHQALVAAEAGLSQITLAAPALDGVWLDDEKTVSLQPTITLYNPEGQAQQFIMERVAWGDQAVTAAEVTTLQRFRDLFASEALRPDEQFAVGSVAILFTDLVGSTQMYNEIGDAPAFGLVRSHFDVLREAIDHEQGAIVKTIGDAVMAVFLQPDTAVRAIMRAQINLQKEAKQTGTRPLLLKAGIHYGACIAVTLNGRLDYFGSTVNIAARLEGLSGPNRVVVSETMAADAEVLHLFEDKSLVAAVEPFETQLKGFNREAFGVWRLTPAGLEEESAER